ncbi:MAG: sulfatase-like hydrolase/transferase [Kiritimatiellia bacterium]
METDATVGRVLDALDRAGAADRTLVLFTSDNGCAPYIGVPEMEAKGHFPSGPLRGYKSDAWEGGHRVPFIARWPGTVKPGSVSDELVHQADLLATCAAIVGAPLPDNAGEDSFSLLPCCAAGRAGPRNRGEPVQRGLFALRHGDWKLIFGKGSARARAPWTPRVSSTTSATISAKRRTYMRNSRPGSPK